MNELLYNFLHWINSWVGSWGWAMVIFTILIRLVLTPLDLKSRVSMRKTSKLQPKLTALQKKYANDKEKLNAKTAELYKKEGINPLSSCLPLLLTWPILIIVFNAMRMASNIEMLNQMTKMIETGTVQGNLEPWLWIKNLWMPDSLFKCALPNAQNLQMIPADQWTRWLSSWGDSLPAALQGLNLTEASFTKEALPTTIDSIMALMGNVSGYTEASVSVMSKPLDLWIVKLDMPTLWNGLMLLPILSAVTQILFTKVSGAQQQQPQAQGQGASTGKFMQWFFPIFSLVICFGYSSAFALYWVAGNVVSMAQTIVINKVLDKKEAQAEIAAEGSVK